MKYILSLVLLTLAVSSGPTFAQEEQGAWEGNQDIWGNELFDTDNWGEDDYGIFDQDFDWETQDDDGFDDWYENAENDWQNYDDAGDASLFDV